MTIAPFPSFFGVGLNYPMRLDSTKSRILIAADDVLVKQSIDSIINTDIDERPFLVRNGVPYGTRIRRTLFDSVKAAQDVIQFDVKRALATWEPRIVCDSVDAQEVTDGPMTGFVVVVHYRFRSTNRADNFVQPYLKKAPT